jgi:outer membrane protein insertion porin family/translocation and assembly module TamA
MQHDSSTHGGSRASDPISDGEARSGRARRGPAPRGWLGVLAVAGAGFSLSACASIPKGRAAIDSIEIVGARAVDPGALLGKLATAPSPLFLGVFRGFGNDYSIYDAPALQRDLARIERYYRGRGFFEAHVRVSRLERKGTDHVSLQIVVDEGPPVNNAGVRVDGLEGVSPAIAEAVRAAAQKALPAGKRFDETSYQEATSAVSRALTDRGYAYAKVQASAQADLASHTIAYAFAVTPGIAAVYGPITFAGLDPDGAGPEQPEIGDSILRRVMHLRQGAPYSTADIQSAEQSLLDLEVFSSAHVVPQFVDPPAAVVPLVVQLEPTKLRALRLGAGAEFDAIKTDLHLLGGWEDHNLLGGLRDFSVDFSPGIVLYPYNTSNLIDRRKDAPPLPRFVPFFEEKLRLQLRQPGFLEPRTTGFVRPEFNVYPLLVNSQPAPGDGVVGYLEPKGAVGVERRFGKHLFATLAYNVQSEIPFEDKAAAPCTTADCAEAPSVPPTVFLTFPQLTMRLDFTDDPVHPHAGVGASLDAQIGTPPGSVTDVRLQPTAAAYIPIARNVTFALGGGLGLLFPIAGYGDYVQNLEAIERGQITPPPPTDSAALRAWQRGANRDIQTVYFRGFFGGGPSDNRGYPLRGVSPHGWVPFLNPAGAQTQAQALQNNKCSKSLSNANLTAADGAETNPFCYSPVGGFSMWQASAELRFNISGPLGVATFCDVGDVSQKPPLDKGAFRFNYLHMSCGAGLRYDTPVGPLRLDVAYRIPFLQRLGCATGSDAAFANSKCGGDPTFGVQPTIFGVPLALALGLGEAF